MQQEFQLTMVFMFLNIAIGGRIISIDEEMKTLQASNDEILAMLKKDGARSAAPQSYPFVVQVPPPPPSDLARRVGS
jgi:hypothetical protein